MLFTRDVLEGIADGRVTLAFRRWRRAPPAVGTTLRTAVGVVSFLRVDAIDVGDITAEDVLLTGMTADALRASIGGEGTLLRIELRLVGADPRLALRERAPSDDERRDIAARLARKDATGAAWTDSYLRLIAANPGVVSRTLAADAQIDVPTFKRRVRQLKELGLTESLEVGYRLSPRGAAFVARRDG